MTNFGGGKLDIDPRQTLVATSNIHSDDSTPYIQWCSQVEGASGWTDRRDSDVRGR